MLSASDSASHPHSSISSAAASATNPLYTAATNGGASARPSRCSRSTAQMGRTQPAVLSLPARCSPGPPSARAASRGPHRYVRNSSFPAVSATVSASRLEAALLCRTACSMLLRMLAPCSRPKPVSRMLRQSCGSSAACSVVAGTCAQKMTCLQTHMQVDRFMAIQHNRQLGKC